MFRDVTAFLERQASLFWHGDLVAYAESFAFPCPGYLPGSPAVLRGPEDLVGGLARLRDGCLRQGLRGVRARVSAVELPRSGRLRVWWRPLFDFPDRTEAGERETIYYLDATRPRGLTVEMVDCGLGLGGPRRGPGIRPASPARPPGCPPPHPARRGR